MADDTFDMPDLANDVLNAPLNPERLKIIIPECCREGWEDCPHVVNRDKKPKRQNPGL